MELTLCDNGEIFCWKRSAVKLNYKNKCSCIVGGVASSVGLLLCCRWCVLLVMLVYCYVAGGTLLLVTFVYCCVTGSALLLVMFVYCCVTGSALLLLVMFVYCCVTGSAVLLLVILVYCCVTGSALLLLLVILVYCCVVGGVARGALLCCRRRYRRCAAAGN